MAGVKELGLIAFERFKEAQADGQPVKNLARLLSEAANWYGQALKSFPPTAVTDLGIVHNQLGNVYASAGAIDSALHHCRYSL